MDIKELYKLYQQHPCITTDSRNCPEGSIFLALRGESFDGNKYALQALEKGCSYAIVDEDIDEPSSHLLKVDDCLQTFKDLAREHRRQFNIPVVGITGTNGKTTTKELIRAVLSECYNVMATEGNFNNDVGVPKTLFRLTDEHDIAVVEMGASHPGDIKTLVETAEPNCGLITNVGRAHLQGFGSFEGVCKTKGELYDFLVSHDCPIFINRDNEHLMQMIQERGQQPDLYFYGQSDNQDILIRGEVVSCAPFLKFRWREQDAEANNRSQLTETEKNHLIVDAYNANPTSMKAALDNFRLMEVSPKMAILGKMGELGDVSDEEHQKIIKLLEEARFDEVWLVGEEFQKANSSFRTFANVDEVKAAIAQEQPQGRYILIKGSNSTHLYELPALL